MPLLASNFTSNSLQGTVVVSGGWANINLQVDAFAFEGDKSFTVKLRKDSTTGQVLGTSNTIAIYDYSGIVSLTANTATVNEGNLVGFTLTTTNVANYTNVFYSVFPVTSNVTLGDFSANTGVVTIINNVGTFALRANSDLSLMDETGETFKLQVRTNSPTGNIVYVSSNVAITDVSKGFNVLSFVENSPTVAEGGTLTLTFNATNVPVGTLFYYSTDGNATTSTFTGGNTGSFVMNGLSNTVTLLPTAVPYNATQNFTVQIRQDSLTGTVLATSNNIIAIDSALAYMNATGGTIVDSGGYRIHAFTTSGNLTVAALGAGPGNLADYLAVAGGGAGFNNTNNGFGGSGGGAGGLINSSFVTTATGNITITIGAGGTGQNNIRNNGSNTTILVGGTTIIAVGGGSGGWQNETGLNGGSGGGAGQSPTARTAASGYGYPSPTQQGYPGSTSGPGLFHGGGGGAGQEGQNGSSPTAGAGGMGAPISWAPSLYGTTGPGPGRYFSGGGGGGGLSDYGNPAGGAGGAGGGGAGQGQSGPTGFAGNVNTGGGGGGRKGAPGTSDTAFGGGSGIVLIRYPYVAPITISNVITTTNSFIMGSNITFTINAVNANAVTLYYSTDGNAILSDFIGGNTGSFVANASGGIVTLRSNTNIPRSESRQFRLQIRQDSTTGFISGSSANVTIDGFSNYITAIGGTVITANGYRTHAFTSSDSFTLYSLAVNPSFNTANILIVGSGGGGGGSNPALGPGASHGGGGGAGGVLTGELTLTANTYTVVVGAGGLGKPQSTPSVVLPNSNVSQTTSFGAITVIGGGGGNAYGDPGNGGAGGTGGSGGGGAASFSVPGPGGAGSVSPFDGLTGYGNPGGGAVTGSGSGGGGGATAAGLAPPAPASTGGPGGAGIGITWVPSSYGRPGPSPTSRYFAGGGAGVSYVTTGIAGVGGGGTAAINGNVNTGGGGGGSAPQVAASTTGTIGGSGIVIIQYPYS
jgi:hypothetical protein